MSMPSATLYFDFVDPVSYLIELSLRALPGGEQVAREGFELRPPPSELTTVGDPFWGDRWALAREEAARLGVELATPTLVPWSRKAMELHHHALSSDPVAGAAVHRAIFDAYAREGADIGRVDVLVEIARGVGLDPTETKAVLDVDRYEAEVHRRRGEAAGHGISTTPTLRSAASRLEGFHNADTLGTFLRDALGSTRDPG